MKSAIILPLLLIGLLTGSCSASPDCYRNSIQKQMCGPRCLLYVCNQLGTEASLSELTKLCGWRKLDGTSMMGLVKAAKAKGLCASAMKISLDELLAAKTPAILLLNDQHFVVVEAKDADHICLTDPPTAPLITVKQRLQGDYTGLAVLLAKSESSLHLPATSGADLRLSTRNWDFGSVYAGEQVTHQFLLKNSGDADLVISEVKPSIVNLGVLLSQTTIAPGQSATADVIFDTSDLTRVQSQKLSFTTNDPVTPVVVLDVTGYVRPAMPAFSPASLSFNTAPGEESQIQSVFVPSTNEDPVNVLSASATNPYIECRVTRAIDNGLDGHRVSVALKADAPVGLLQGKVLIQTDRQGSAIIEVPVTATVVGDVDADQDMFFFGLVKSGVSEASVTIRSLGNRAVHVKSVECDLPYVKTEVSSDRGVTRVVAKLDASSARGLVRGRVVIHTDSINRPLITLPVSAYVED